MRIAIVPGNGCDDIMTGNWYAWLADRLAQSGRFSEVLCKTMPDPYRAQRLSLIHISEPTRPY